MSEVAIVDVAAWVERARRDPVGHFERQATEVVLNAIGMTGPLGNKILLKGGALMGVVYRSPRQTADLDFTTSLQPTAGVDAEIIAALNEALPHAAVQLGYPDIVSKVQSARRLPRVDRFIDADFPALKIKIGYAHRGSTQERALAIQQCANVIELDISFNEPVSFVETVKLGSAGPSISVYSLIDLIAEKTRALLQQKYRRRNRRQDVYDIALLLKQFPLDHNERNLLHKVLLEKCRSRRIEPTIDSISDPEIVQRAQMEWGTLELELGEVPEFENCFKSVESFYRSLPWSSS